MTQGVAVELKARLPKAVVESELFLQALTHRSSSLGQAGRSNERLEFLGDSVLGTIVTQYLFRSYADLDEGRMSKIRAAVVNEDSLAEVGRAIGISASLIMGSTEESMGGREKPSIISDALEAVIAAVYLESGLDPTSSFVIGLLKEKIDGLVGDRVLGDFKSALQERLALSTQWLPRYEDHWTGPDHLREYTSTVFAGEELFAEGVGRSKKQAQQAAAQRLLEVLDHLGL